MSIGQIAELADTIIEDAVWRGQPVDREDAGVLARFVLEQMRVHPQAELSVLLVDVEAMTQLHVQWMDEPGPTDVMSFPMDELRPGLVNEEPEEGVLGDLVLCASVADRQAAEAGHPARDEVELLTVHGILHLLGYDHAEPEEHKEMFDLQATLLVEWRDGGR